MPKITDFLIQNNIGDLSNYCALADFLQETNHPLAEYLQSALLCLRNPTPPEVIDLLFNDLGTFDAKPYHFFEMNVIRSQAPCPKIFFLLGNTLFIFISLTGDSHYIHQIPDSIKELAIFSFIKIFLTASYRRFTLSIEDSLFQVFLNLFLQEIKRMNKLVNKIDQDPKLLRQTNTRNDLMTFAMKPHRIRALKYVVGIHRKQYPNSQSLQYLKETLTNLYDKAIIIFASFPVPNLRQLKTILDEL